MTEFHPRAGLSQRRVRRLTRRVAKWQDRLVYWEERGLELQSLEAWTITRDRTLADRQQRLKGVARLHRRAWRRYLTAMNDLYGPEWPVQRANEADGAAPSQSPSHLSGNHADLDEPFDELLRSLSGVIADGVLGEIVARELQPSEVVVDESWAAIRVDGADRLGWLVVTNDRLLWTLASLPERSRVVAVRRYHVTDVDFTDDPYHADDEEDGDEGVDESGDERDDCLGFAPGPLGPRVELGFVGSIDGSRGWGMNLDLQLPQGASMYRTLHTILDIERGLSD